MTDVLKYEKSLWNKGVELVAGLDEVGRGCLAGPMVVGAVILKRGDLDHLTNNDIYSQIKDSKLLTPKKRDLLSTFIIQNCLCYSFFEVSSEEIDQLGISACTQKSFFGAIKSLSISPEHILTDAFAIKAFPNTVQTNLISGDRLSLTISAASVIAKVYRDNLMCKLGENEMYSKYEFNRHKGYGTKLHLEKIRQFGLSNIHRKTFIHL